jgi:hypothetical protein
LGVSGDLAAGYIVKVILLAMQHAVHNLQTILGALSHPNYATNVDKLVPHMKGFPGVCPSPNLKKF